MPFFKISDMEVTRPELGRAEMRTVAGELMKVGHVTYQAGDGPPPHFHPNEEQFLYMLEGRMRMQVGDETRTVGPGDLVHIPRNAVHGIHITEGPAKFFTCKSPAGDGDLNQDYNKAPEAENLRARLEANATGD
ncbi:MAG: cupin domain-containing protein [Rhodospirillales bacterium]|nr:MAG: cupin domain-containing protein [Rhodospirillales bacterium]